MPDAPFAPPPVIRTPVDRPLVGIGWMVLTGLLFVGVTAGVKHGAKDLPAPESAFLRYVFGLVWLLPAWREIRAAPISRTQLRIFGIRGFAHAFAVMLWFFAMTRITIAEVTAMNYMTPVYITLAAALVLGERLAMRRIVAILLAFLGALLILRPGLRELDEGHFAMILAAILFAFSYLIAKRVSSELPASTIVAMLSIVVTVSLAPFAFAVWRTPTLSETGWIMVVAFLATAGHYSMTRAFAAAPVSVTQPVTFLQLIWSVLLGVFVFGEGADAWVIVGGTVIIAATTFIAIREAMLSRAIANGKDST